MRANSHTYTDLPPISLWAGVDRSSSLFTSGSFLRETDFLISAVFLWQGVHSSVWWRPGFSCGTGGVSEGVARTPRSRTSAAWTQRGARGKSTRNIARRTSDWGSSCRFLVLHTSHCRKSVSFSHLAKMTAYCFRINLSARSIRPVVGLLAQSIDPHPFSHEVKPQISSVQPRDGLRCFTGLPQEFIQLEASL
jgi:hypothetical protein